MQYKLPLLILASLLAAPLASVAAPAPVPGGANQLAGIQGDFQHPAFNGSVRIKSLYFGAPQPGDDLGWGANPPADKQILVFKGVISNGRPQAYLDNPVFTLADADGVTADTKNMSPTTFNLLQAAGSRVVVAFWVPKDFTPHHILFTCSTAKCKPMRILLPAK
jgi:hypothetical protein